MTKERHNCLEDWPEVVRPRRTDASSMDRIDECIWPVSIPVGGTNH